MKRIYLPTIQCPCCKKYYIIQCKHPESGSDHDEANIAFASSEYFELKNVKDETT